MNPFAAKMTAAGCPPTAIRAFERALATLKDGSSPTLSEEAITPVQTLPKQGDLSGGVAPVDETVVIKLNGGLGTSMGLTRAKSLLPVRDGHTFLDLIARQVLHQRTEHPGLRFLLMNSFSTDEDTHAALPDELGDPDALCFLQNQVPKVHGGRPLDWPSDPELEWCPPGHGDLYVALATSGKLEELLSAGVRYAFVSNSDNLGATLDPAMLAWFASSGAGFAMEVTRRTPADRKGGHLALLDGQLTLREAAMCAEEDRDAFQDIERHRFFNTNNLWLRLDHLAELLEAHDGVLPLPVIHNRKTADPRDPTSPPVVQLETAMGSAITCFPQALAIDVDRSRFAPVKKTSDLLAVRSDAYALTDDHRIVLARARPPALDLDPSLKLVDALDEAFPQAPSLLHCSSLTVRGPVRFAPGVVLHGDIRVENGDSSVKTVPAGTYQDATIAI